MRRYNGFDSIVRHPASAWVDNVRLLATQDWQLILWDLSSARQDILQELELSLFVYESMNLTMKSQ